MRRAKQEIWSINKRHETGEEKAGDLPLAMPTEKEGKLIDGVMMGALGTPLLNIRHVVHET